MRMTKLGYFAEFVVLPAFLILLAALTDEPVSGWWGTHSFLAFLAGALSWTLIEYLLHRFVFHHAPVVSAMHERHHESPLELIGAPAWVSLLAGMCCVLLPLYLLLGMPLAIAATSGVTAGYLWYVLIHYATHHVQPEPDSFLHRARVRHLRHHYAPGHGNFGVTSGFWDRVFGTALERHRPVPIYRRLYAYWTAGRNS